MGLKEWLIPQDKAFFILLGRQSNNIFTAAKLLFDLVQKYEPKKLARQRKILKNLEHEGDDIVHQIYERLCQTFITPFDHEDIAKLASNYDDVIDHIYAVVNRLYLYDIAKPTRELKKFAKLILEQVKRINKAMKVLKKVDKKIIENSCIEVHRLENTADQLLNQSVASLFLSDDLKEIIKFKEIYGLLEIATDKCEDVSDVLRNILMKNL